MPHEPEAVIWFRNSFHLESRKSCAIHESLSGACPAYPRAQPPSRNEENQTRGSVVGRGWTNWAITRRNTAWNSTKIPVPGIQRDGHSFRKSGSIRRSPRVMDGAARRFAPRRVFSHSNLAARFARSCVAQRNHQNLGPLSSFPCRPLTLISESMPTAAFTSSTLPRGCGAYIFQVSSTAYLHQALALVGSTSGVRKPAPTFAASHEDFAGRPYFLARQPYLNTSA